MIEARTFRPVLLVFSVLLGVAGCFSRGQELSDRGDELLYQRRFEEAAGQFELVLHECGDKTDEETRLLRVRTLKKIAELKHFYLSDLDGALRTYRLIMELSPNGDAGYQAHLSVVRLMRSRGTESSAVISEIERLMTKFPSRVNGAEWNLELAEIAFQSARYAATEKHARHAKKSKSLKVRVEASLLLASTQEMQKRFAEAVATYEALQREPNLPDSEKHLIELSIAHCFEKMGQLEKARKLYDQAKSHSNDPDFIALRIERINARIQEREVKTRPRSRLRSAKRAKARTSTQSEY